LPSPTAIRHVVAAYFAATRAMDLDAWLGTFAADAVDHEPVGTPPVVGHQRLRQFFQTITAAFEKVGITEDHVFVAGNRAAVKWTGRGVGKNGRAVTFEGIDVFEINEQGKIQTLWGYWNPAPLMAELMADD
jgi:steroid delta-isomerase